MNQQDHGLEKALAFGLGGCLLLSFAGSAIAYVTSLLTRTLSQLEQHKISIALIVAATVVLYVWIRLKVRSFRRRHAAQRWPSAAGAVHAPPTYTYDPRVDRPGLLGTFGRWLAVRSGGPLIVSGGQPVGTVRRAPIDEDDEEPEDDEDQEPEERPRRHTQAEAREAYSRILRAQ